MAAPDSSNVIDAAMHLRAAAPDQWRVFVAAMGDYSVMVAASLISCDPHMLPRGQGMAIQANEVATLLADAPKIYEKLQQAREKQRVANIR